MYEQRETNLLPSYRSCPQVYEQRDANSLPHYKKVYITPRSITLFAKIVSNLDRQESELLENVRTDLRTLGNTVYKEEARFGGQENGFYTRCSLQHFDTLPKTFLGGTTAQQRDKIMQTRHSVHDTLRRRVESSALFPGDILQTLRGKLTLWKGISDKKFQWTTLCDDCDSRLRDRHQVMELVVKPKKIREMLQVKNVRLRMISVKAKQGCQPHASSSDVSTWCSLPPAECAACRISSGFVYFGGSSEAEDLSAQRCTSMAVSSSADADEDIEELPTSDEELDDAHHPEAAVEEQQYDTMLSVEDGMLLDVISLDDSSENVMSFIRTIEETNFKHVSPDCSGPAKLRKHAEGGSCVESNKLEHESASNKRKTVGRGLWLPLPQRPRRNYLEELFSGK